MVGRWRVLSEKTVPGNWFARRERTATDSELSELLFTRITV